MLSTGDTVSVLPHEGKNDDGSTKSVIGVVTNPKRLTDMVRLDNTRVEYYVDVQINKGGPSLGYHENSLRKLP